MAHRDPTHMASRAEMEEGVGGKGGVITPCGRCRQVLNELAQLGGTDPLIWCVGDDDVLEVRLSALLPYAFGPGSLT